MGRGWVPPGYKYLGPGNDLNRGEPTNYNDSVAYKHDVAYQDILNQDGDPYRNWTKADQEFLDNLSPNDFWTYVAQGLFTVKKGAYKVGLIGEVKDMSKRSWYSSEKGKKAVNYLKAAAEEKKATHGDTKRLRGEDTSVGNPTSQGTKNEPRAPPRIDPVDPNTKTKNYFPTQAPKEDNGMDVEMTNGETPTVVQSAKAQGGGDGGGGNGTGETPVELNLPRELGIFTETRTTILPLRFGVSFNKMRYNLVEANVLKIRMNAPYNILKDTTFVNHDETTSSNGGIGTHQAIAYKQTGAEADAGTNSSAHFSFETTLVPATAQTASTTGSGVVADANCVPGWRKWYEKIYESYHVIETQYRITFINPESAIGRRVRAYVDKDVYTTNSTGNVMPVNAEPLYMNSVWKNIDTVILGERNNYDEPWMKTITGTWRPNIWSKNTLNAEDIKAWYASGAEPSPAWTENLVICGMTDEHNTSPSNMNAFVELRYIVQWKDLKTGFRYPKATDSTTALNMPGDVIQIPNTQYNWGVSA